MDKAVCDLKDPFELPKELRKKSENRRIIWENFFKKCEKVSSYSSSTYKLSEVPEYVHDEVTMNYSNRVAETNLTQREQSVVDKIENELKSSLNQLILQREKSKILHEPGEYTIIHPKVKDEIRRIRQFATREDLEMYIGLCVVPNKDTEHLIEEVLYIDLKTTLMHHRTMLDNSKLSFWSMKLRTEWDYLTRTLPEEEVVVYAVNVIKKLECKRKDL